MEKISVKGRTLVDGHGRERIFNGINLCDKGTYDKSIGRRNYIYDRDDSIIEEFKKAGMNLVRLGVTWDAVEPERGKYNEVYLESVKRTLDKLEKVGIYAYIDMHQDLYSGWGMDSSGDGAPLWACRPGAHTFRNPRLVWAEGYFFSGAVHTAFQNFFDNKYSLLDDYVNMWKFTAQKLDGHPALFGFDVLNEPFAGKYGGKIFFKLISSLISTTLTDKGLPKLEMIKQLLSKDEIIKILDFYNGDIFNKIVNKASYLVNKFDIEKYMPFLDKVSAGIREVSPDPIIFIENSYYSNLGIKFDGRPIRVDGRKIENQVFSPHAYDLMVDTPMYKYASSGRVKSIFDERKKEQESGLDMPVIVGEWGGFSEGTQWLDHIEFLLSLYDKNKWSNTYWSYFDGIFEKEIWDVLKRPYPIAVTGDIVLYKHNRDKNTFTLVYDQNREFDAPTEIFAHKPIESVEIDEIPIEYDKEEIDDNSSVIKLNTNIGRHKVKVNFKGEGFSYTKIKEEGK